MLLCDPILGGPHCPPGQWERGDLGTSPRAGLVLLVCVFQDSFVKNSSFLLVQCCCQAVKASLHCSSCWGCTGRLRCTVFTAGCPRSQPPCASTNKPCKRWGFYALFNEWQVITGQVACYLLCCWRPLHPWKWGFWTS